MNTSLTRKKFLVNSGIAVAGMLCGRDVLRAQPGTTSLVPSPQSADNVPDFPEHDPQIDRARVKRFVIAGHFNLPAVEKMLAEDPTLINGAADWGNGDFENALGGASHMGRRDIAEFLLAHNARMDIFAATMLGKIDIVKAAVTAFQNIVPVPGRMAFFDCGSVRLMLAIPERPDLDHPSSILYFKVPDIEQAHEGLVSRKVHFETKPMLVASMATHDLWLAEFRDSENNVLAL